MKFRNPVVPGSYPDPSVCRVGRDYYLASSTFAYFPGVPILHSRDLVHWRQIGHCLTRASQLDLRAATGVAGIYAPTLRHHEGTFYMVTTNVNGGGNFYVTARDPAGPWSDPLWVDDGAFDPSLFFDDDGKVYYTRRCSGGIAQAEIDVETGRLLTPARRIAQGFCSPDIEGPHLYKIDGTYYLMAAEGGTRFGHSETIARSGDPWGPYEPCPRNPILTHRHLSGQGIRDVGHAELVEAHDGSWWLFCLGTRQWQYENSSHLGRETFLAPVTWTDDGWPLVGHDGTVIGEYDAGAIEPHTWPEKEARDDFGTGELAHCWFSLRNPSPQDRFLTERPGWLRLRGSEAALDDPGEPTFVGRRQRHMHCRAAALIDFCPAAPNEEAGLTTFMTREHHYEIAVTIRDGARSVVVRKRVGDLQAEVACQAVSINPLVLEIAATPQRYTFTYAAPGGESHTLASGLTKLISPELAGSWTGVTLAMYATGHGRPCTRPADYGYFEYEKTAEWEPSDPWREYVEDEDA